jgi:hypothetical protein
VLPRIINTTRSTFATKSRYALRPIRIRENMCLKNSDPLIHIQAGRHLLEYVILRGAIAECSRRWSWVLSIDVNFWQYHCTYDIRLRHIRVTTRHVFTYPARSQLGFNSDAVRERWYKEYCGYFGLIKIFSGMEIPESRKEIRWRRSGVLTLYPRRYSRGISDIPPRRPRLTKIT